MSADGWGKTDLEQFRNMGIAIEDQPRPVERWTFTPVAELGKKAPEVPNKSWSIWWLIGGFVSGLGWLMFFVMWWIRA